MNIPHPLAATTPSRPPAVPRLALLAFLALWCVSGVAHAATEAVRVVKVLDDSDKGIIQRRNGETWLIEKGVGALSFSRCEGKTVYIDSPGLFCGVGASLIIPDSNQKARIWNAEQLPDSTEVTMAARSTAIPIVPEGAKATASALVLLGYFDPDSADDTKTNAVRALEKFKAANKVSEAKLGPLTQAKLAELILREKGSTPAGLDLALALVQSARQMRGVPTAAPEGTETYISSVSSDGSVVKLADGTIYEIDAIGQVHTMLWLPVQRVLKMPGSLLNLSNGQKVSATPVE